MITVYSTPNCALCKTLKDLLNINLIEYQEYEIGLDISKEDLETMVGYTLRSAPAVFIDDTFLGGFQETNRYINQLNKQKHDDEIQKAHEQLANELKTLGIDLL